MKTICILQLNMSIDTLYLKWVVQKFPKLSEGRQTIPWKISWTRAQGNGFDKHQNIKNTSESSSNSSSSTTSARYSSSRSRRGLEFRSPETNSCLRRSVAVGLFSGSCGWRVILFMIQCLLAPELKTRGFNKNIETCCSEPFLWILRIERLFYL